MSPLSAGTGPPVLALTFDDGPDPEWTPRVLAALAAARARATFFVMAERAAAAPALVERMRADGHRVELHCVRHVRHRVAGRRAVEEDTARGLALLRGLGARPRRWRPPWGEQAPFTAEVARAHELRLCGWSVDTRDWRGDRAEAMLEAARPGVAPGAVVLMHDGVGPGALRRGCAQTVRLVAPMVALGRARGLEPAPLGVG